MNYKRPLTFALTFLIFQFISCIVTCKKYINSVNEISKKEYNLSTYPNNIINFCSFFFGYWLLAFMFYSLFHKYDESIYVISFFGTIMWGLWDFFPICTIQDGYKHSFIFFSDMFITGGFCIGLSAYIYKNYYNILSKNIYILFMIYATLFFVLWYYGFILNREGTENNLLVKLGDSLNLDKILPYVTL